MRINRRDFIKTSGGIMLAAGSACATRGGTARKDRSPFPVQDEYFILPPKPRTFEDGPSLICEQGRIRLGIFKTPARKLNLSGARIIDESPYFFPEFIGFGVTHPDFYFGAIIMDPKIAPHTAALYVYDRRTGRMFDYSRLCGSSNARVAANTWHDSTYVRRPGFLMEFEHRLEEGWHGILFDIQEEWGMPSIKGRLKLPMQAGVSPNITVSMPFVPRNWCYTQKAYLPVEGEIRVGTEKLAFNPARDVANLDESRNYLPLSSSWVWGTCGGFLENGEFIGMNVGTRSASNDNDAWNENCLWLGGKPHLLGEVAFDFDGDNLKRKWTLKEKHGRLDLEFQPEGILPVGSRLIGIKYFQSCGKYTGTIVDDSGKSHRIDNLYGVFENGIIGWP
jgi:hypothetical protein